MHITFFIIYIGYAQLKFNEETGALEPISRENISTYLKTQHAYPFTKNIAGNFKVSIDLHWSFGGSVDDYTLIEEKLLEGRLPFKVMGVMSWRLSNENLLLHSCLHHYWHAKNNMHIKIGRLCDIGYILWKFKDELRWDAFLEDCKAHKITGQIAFSLKQTEKVYPGIVPPVLLNELSDATISLDRLLSQFMIREFIRPRVVKIPSQLTCYPIQ